MIPNARFPLVVVTLPDLWGGSRISNLQNKYLDDSFPFDSHPFAVEEESVHFKSSCVVLGESPRNSALRFNC